MSEYNSSTTSRVKVPKDQINYNTVVESIEEINQYLEMHAIPRKGKGYYNCYSLCLDINMELSDYAYIKELSSKAKTTCLDIDYHFDVEQLKDKDRPKWIRFYFELE